MIGRAASFCAHALRVEFHEFQVPQARSFCYIDGMKLIRFGEAGREWPGILMPDGKRIDASGQFADYDEGFFAMGGLESLAEWAEDGCPGGAEVDSLMRLGPPIARPSKVVCIGKNYLEHAKELGEGIPSEPTLFMKATTAWSGPYDDVVIPRGGTKLDYEVELAVVIGRTATYVEEQDAMEYVAGYSTFCDYSERAFQKEMGGQWTKGKSADTFAPMGPWMVTTEEISDVQHLRLWCEVNGELRQNSWTSDMMCSVRQLVSYVSRFMTLLPGDVLATGTPGGVAMGTTPHRYLQAGDFVECGVEGLGTMGQRVVVYSES
jgi:2,4-diketo-3-deoxy-L-fuconate hydrolase